MGSSAQRAELQPPTPKVRVGLTKTPVCFQLADSLVPMEMKPGISLATVSAVLHTKDNKHVLQVPRGGWPGGTRGTPRAWNHSSPPQSPSTQLAPRTLLPKPANPGDQTTYRIRCET